MKRSYHTLGAALSLAALLTVSASAQLVTTSTTTTSAGTISEFSPDAIVIKNETDSGIQRYTYRKTTTYVDETGAPVSLETVRSGLPVTVQYVKEGDQMIASRVIVRRATATTTAPAPVVIEKRVVEPAPVVIEKRVSVPAPVVIEKRVSVPAPAPAIIEKRVSVPAPAPVIIEKKTTTTTTSETKN